MELDKIARRSRERVTDRVPDDSPLKGDDGRLLCPWCQRPMRVRFTTLGHIYETPEGSKVYIDGVGMKCAGTGCGYRPDFDVPITDEVYEEEFELRGNKRSVKMGKSAEESDEVMKRLENLGYIV